MKTLLVNTFDVHGGAAIATYRLYKGLRDIGVDSSLLVQRKFSSDYRVIGPETRFAKLRSMARPHVEQMSLGLHRHRPKSLFSPAWVPERFVKACSSISPQLVHLFWVNGGFMRIESLKGINRPVVWTLHDMWPLTGGCHYDAECGRFRGFCGQCPVLGSDKQRDLSYRVLARKRNAWKDVPITIVATSQWLANMARESVLFRGNRVEVIPNGLDVTVYKPLDKTLARDAYNLPHDKKLVLFSAFSANSDARKGGQFLEGAFKKLAREGLADKIELLVLGASQPRTPVDFGMPVRYMGEFHDEVSQVLLYSAADVLVAPSMQENLANTVLESLACGTPVVAFDVGGMPDMIAHKENGYLAEPFDENDLANGMAWVIENDDRQRILAASARDSVLEKYGLDRVAGLYKALYADILQQDRN